MWTGLHVNATPLYMKDFSILKFWHPLGFWNQAPTDSKEGLYLHIDRESRVRLVWFGIFVRPISLMGWPASSQIVLWMLLLTCNPGDHILILDRYVSYGKQLIKINISDFVCSRAVRKIYKFKLWIGPVLNCWEHIWQWSHDWMARGREEAEVDLAKRGICCIQLLTKVPVTAEREIVAVTKKH